MSKVLPNFLHTEEEDSFVFGELAVPQTQNEELSIEEEALLFDTQDPVDLLPIFENTGQVVNWDDSAHTGSSYTAGIDPISTENDRSFTLHASAEGAEMFNQAVRVEAISQANLTLPEIGELRSYMSHPAESLVERMIPVQDLYNRQMYAAQVAAEQNAILRTSNDYAIAGALAAITEHVTQVGDITWRSARVGSRDTRPIELIDDEA